ncbi:MAG TPA: aminoacyl-tRNA hydrolase [Tepidisphaeraceae bacterium]|jgi:PTH1 family peptidyl-tRNA hydrolase|nr:aminoacyl-tRNA hydrolase [Tepidisphaeraceae bacterium]
MKLVVGLGNPGREYVGTRHNIGFEVLDRLAAKIGLIASPSDFDRQARSNFDGLALDGPAVLGAGKQERFLLLKPLTFMNLSGKAVQAAKAFYQLSDGDLMIVLDDLALPCGKIRLRANGSSGGHNGLRDIERALGTSEYPRLRVGIDPKPDRVPQRDYVLGKFSEEQRKQVNPAIDRAAEALLVWADQGIVAAMNRFNAKTELSNGTSET